MIKLEFDCPENSASMPVRERGYFCASCDRIITDFTAKSNTEIKAMLEKNVGKTCGVFRSSQVENVYQSKLATLFRWAFAAVFILGFNASILFGQDSTSIAPILDTTLATPIPNDNVIIQGNVLDNETGEAIPFSKIIVEIDNQFFYAATDFDGNYSIKVPRSVAHGKTFSIKTNYIHYDEQEKENLLIPVGSDKITVDFELTEGEHLLLGFLIIEQQPPIKTTDPSDFGKTVINREDIELWW